MNKKEFKPILVHRIPIDNENIIMSGKCPKKNRIGLFEKKNSFTFEELIENYKEEFKQQAPETYENYEHAFFPAQLDYCQVETIPIPIDASKKTCVFINCRRISEQQTEKEYIKNFKKTTLNNLSNSLDYYEFIFIYNTLLNEEYFYYLILEYETLKTK